MLDGLDPVLLARIQFGFVIAFHILFPAMTIGLASYLAVLRGLHLWTRLETYDRLFRYWIKPFALIFGMGVVSGLVMSYQFGTNWSVFSERAGPVVGPLMGYEVLTAFFLEAGFLGIMLFGKDRVGKGLHFFATLMVAFGTALSAFWILSVNSWMQTPAGFSINEAGQFVPEDWWAIVFNPSFPYRLVHMVLAAYLSTAFIVGATGAYHLLRGRRDAPVRTMVSMAMWMAAIVAPAQIVMGDLHGLNTLEHQPAKIAAMEGHFETDRGAPLLLFGLPDRDAGETRYAVGIPHLGSLILTHEWNGEIKGLKAFPREDWPNTALVFWTFRAMVGIGMLMALAGMVSLWLRWKGRLYDTPWFQRALVGMGPAGLVAIICGWITTEVGRQPYVVYGELRTYDAVSPIALPGVAGSLLAFIVVYVLVFGAGTFYVLRQLGQAPRPHEPGKAADTPVRAAGITPAAGQNPDAMAHARPAG
ncbi:MAG: cytochrome ubiquinol oxidase subunit I [Geminicoccaceae bacterium]|nr:cytochrome ubiquinol oxidase subunit I [Geminicoccaceae bacterium]